MWSGLFSAIKTAAMSDEGKKVGFDAMRKIGQGAYEKIFNAPMKPVIFDETENISQLSIKIDTLSQSIADRQEVASAFSSLQAELVRRHIILMGAIGGLAIIQIITLGLILFLIF